MDLDGAPYLVLFLKEADNLPLCNANLQIPLLLACSMSKFIHIVFPLDSASLRLVDSTFDSLINTFTRRRCDLHSNFVKHCKGIQYARDLPGEEKKHLLERATFVLTTNCQVRSISLMERLPHAFISLRHDDEVELRVQYLERINDEKLRENLDRCVDLSLNDNCLASSARMKLQREDMSEKFILA